MKLDLEEKGGVSVLVLSGQLTGGAAAQFREAVDTLLGAGRTRILVRFADVPFMDSTGIGELVASLRTVRRFGGDLKILRPSPKVEESLEIARLLPLFEVFEDESAAVASFARS